LVMALVVESTVYSEHVYVTVPVPLGTGSWRSYLYALVVSKPFV